MAVNLMPGFGAFTPASGGVLLDGSESDGTNVLAGTDALSAWLISGATLTRSVVLAPNGATDGATLVGNGSSGRHLGYEEVASWAPDTYTFSIYAKQDTLRYIQLIMGGNGGFKAWVYADLQAGTITDTGDQGSGTLYISSAIAAAVNGYYKVSITFSDAGFATPGYVQVALSDRATHTGSLESDSPDFTTSSGIYLWRPKLVAI
jgi:hypothetical protein